MAAARRRVIRYQELEEILTDVLNESDLETADPFAREDDDELDEDYLQDRDDQQSTSSEEPSSEGEEQSVSNIPPQQTRGRGRSRGRSRTRSRRVPRRPLQSLSRGRSILNQPRHLSLEDLTADFSSSFEEENEWVECTFEPEIVPLFEPAYLPVDRRTFGTLDYFRQYIDDNMIQNIVNKSNQSYLARNGKCLNLTFAECNTYFAISMIMSAISYPCMRMYWSKKFRVPIIADSMPRNRFLIIRNSVKLVLDEEVSDDDKRKDKLWKVQPLINAVLKGCRLQQKPKNLSIDEMIIPFQGTCGLKQYCPGKPNPVGLKAFVLAAPNGLVCNFDIYQGNTTYPDYNNTNFSLAEKAVLHLVEDLVPGHVIFCDRYFTSENLILGLQDKGLMCAGTLMKNRIPKTAREVLTDDKVMKKKSRGSWQVVVNKAKKLAITKWVDSKPITFMSNLHADQMIDGCERWSKKTKRYISVPRPQVVKQYNANMGGVDLADRMLAVCPNRYRTKKWTQRFISHMVDLAVCNAWILFKQDQLANGTKLHKIQQLRSFKLEIAEAILEANADTESEHSSHDDSDRENVPTFRNRKVPVPLPSEGNRTRGAMHLPEVSKTQNKCRQIGCRKKTKMLCIKCNIYLCLTRERNCFRDFHIPR